MTVSGDAQGGETRDARIGHILNEYLDHRVRGEAEPETQFLARYPELAGELRLHLRTLQEIGPTGSSIHGLIAQGLLGPSADPRYLAELGPYKINGVLGRGGMGVVLTARDESLNRLVAIKILRPELTADESAVVRFQQEAKAAAALRHPNILTVYSVGREGNTLYFAMEYIDGPSLAEVIRDDGCLPTESVRDIFRQLLAGLAVAHEAGLIHRDVKSSNILLDGYWRTKTSTESVCETHPVQSRARLPLTSRSDVKGREADGSHSEDGSLALDVSRLAKPHPQSRAREEADGSYSEDRSLILDVSRLAKPHPSVLVKIVDFGLARVLSSTTRLTLPQAILGTPEYMSPEQARGDEDLDHRADLYSAGVVLYEMLTGRTPFHADTPTAVIHRILHEDPADPRDLQKTADPCLSNLALRLMAKHPDDRLPSASETLGALDTGRRVRCRARRSRWARRVVVVVGVVSAVYLGACLVRAWSDIARAQPDKNYPLTVRVRGSIGEWRDFFTFPANADKSVCDLGNVPGAGRCVFAGTGIPVDLPEDQDTAVGNLFAFDRKARLLWKLYLRDEPLHHWADVEGKDRTSFACRAVAAADLDGIPGDEVVGLAAEVNYPSRLSIIDPRNGAIRWTFWHMGNLDGLFVVANYFEPGHPALVVWGVNNKLDGFDDDELREGEVPPGAHWDYVPVVMVLDPRKLDGLGPPPTTDRVQPPIRPAYVHAYAFLDLPPGEDVAARPVPPDGPAYLPKERTATIAGVGRAAPDALGRERSSDRPCLRVNIGRAHNLPSRVDLVVDRRLRLQRVPPPGPSHMPGDENLDYWARLWHVIIADGQYITPPEKE